MSKKISDIQDLADRIEKLKNKHKKKEKKAKNSGKSMYVNVLQISIEMISPLIIASCIGYMLDKTFDTLPFMMLIMVVFGIATGVLNGYRYAMKIDKETKED